MLRVMRRRAIIFVIFFTSIYLTHPHSISLSLSFVFLRLTSVLYTLTYPRDNARCLFLYGDIRIF